MFEINPKIEIKKEYLDETTIFLIDDFYEKPDEVFSFLDRENIPLWKMEQKPTNNGVYFEDRRTIEYNYAVKKVYDFKKFM